MLEVKHLNATYGQHPALEDASLTVAKGEIVVILGANGAGKSTLLRSIAGICEGEVSGEITLSGKSLRELSADDIVESGISLVPEGRGIFADLSVKENLLLGAYSARARDAEKENLQQVLSLFPKLGERQHQIARTMSGGEQQMVAIGRAMMSAPDILMLDEPSLGLAPLLCKELFQNLQRVKQLQIGILLVEQNARQSLAIADRGYLLENTRITHEDTAASLATDPAVQKAYLGAGVSSVKAKQAHPATSAAPSQMPATGVFSTGAEGVRRSADQRIGASIDELVAGATRASAQALTTAYTVSTAVVPTAGHKTHSVTPGSGSAASVVSSGEVKRITLDIEQAAREARRRAATGSSRRSARYRAKPAGVSAGVSEPQPQDNLSVPVIEVYKRPRVEVYRRRPGGDFERD
ncbi:MAG: ABC transporter ATP-binding protein [Pseudomonadota bacterium]